MRKKRTPWPRWAKILRNILLTALLGFMMWDAWGWPTFFFHADLRRTERRMLFPEPELAAEIETTGGVPYRIELAGDTAVTAYPSHGTFFTIANKSVHHLKKGPNLICISRPVELSDGTGPSACYAALRPPENAARAVLALHNDDGDFLAEGIRKGEIYLFYARPEPDEYGRVQMGGNWFFLPQCTYELAFYDADGNVIQEISG